MALAAVAAGDFPLMVELVLDYYDKTYTYGLAPRPDEPPRTLVPVAGCEAAENAALLVRAAATATVSTSPG